MIHELHGLMHFGEGRTVKHSPMAEHLWLKQGGREREKEEKEKDSLWRIGFFPLFCLFVLTAWLVGFSSTLGTGTDFLSLCDMHFQMSIKGAESLG